MKTTPEQRAELRRLTQMFHWPLVAFHENVLRLNSPIPQRTFEVSITNWYGASQISYRDFLALIQYSTNEISGLLDDLEAAERALTECREELARWKSGENALTNTHMHIRKKIRPFREMIDEEGNHGK